MTPDKLINMKTKIVLVTLLVAGICGFISANNPDKNKGNPGNDTVKDGSVKAGAIKPAATKTVTPAPVKPKVTPPPAPKPVSYENKAPSVFTFTVLSTYFNMPIQKK